MKAAVMPLRRRQPNSTEWVLCPRVDARQRARRQARSPYNIGRGAHPYWRRSEEAATRLRSLRIVLICRLPLLLYHK